MFLKLGVILKIIFLLAIMLIGISFGSSTSSSENIFTPNFWHLLIVFIGPFIGLYIFLKLFGYTKLNKPSIVDNIFESKNILSLILYLGYVLISFCMGLIISGITYNFHKTLFFIISICMLFGLGCILSAYIMKYFLNKD